MAESEVGEVGPTVFGGCWVGTKFGWTTVFGRGGGLELTVFGGGALGRVFLSFALSGGSTGESGGGRLVGGRFVFGVSLSVALSGRFIGELGGGRLGGGRLVSGVALSVAFGTVCGSVGGDGLESLESGGPVALERCVEL